MQRDHNMTNTPQLAQPFPALVWISSVLAVTSPSIGKEAFNLSTDWHEPTLVFDAHTDRLGKHRYQCYREPVVIKTNSRKLVNK